MFGDRVVIQAQKHFNCSWAWGLGWVCPSPTTSENQITHLWPWEEKVLIVFGAYTEEGT